MENYKHKEEDFPTFKSEGLAIISAYLYFINTGQIKCEDHGHHRPCHQANLAYSMFKVMDQELTQLNSETSKSNCHIIRLLKTQLPSFADQFTVSVPMTRIRDIAHRNDIPQELK